MAALLEAEPERIDFLQINYSLGERTSAERVLPMAHERGIAVMVNRPFAGGSLFGAVRDRPLPGWADGGRSRLRMRPSLGLPLVLV